MNISFRDATHLDVQTVIDLLRDDNLGADREGADIATYLDAFDAMVAEGNNHLIVALIDDKIVGTYQITYISGLSLRAARRAQIESVRVASYLRGQGIGRLVFRDAERRARKAGCQVMQLTTNKSRDRAQTFYQQLGFTPTHVGYKRVLD